MGVVTGHKYNAFTFSVDERGVFIFILKEHKIIIFVIDNTFIFIKDQGGWWENLIFAIMDRKAEPLSFLTRSLMENETTFDSALQRLSTQDLIAPAYFILGGVNGEQGAVVTRFQDKLVDVWRLNASSAGIEKWYLLETNYDHW